MVFHIAKRVLFNNCDQTDTNKAVKRERKILINDCIQLLINFFSLSKLSDLGFGTVAKFLEKEGQEKLFLKANDKIVSIKVKKTKLQGSHYFINDEDYIRIINTKIVMDYLLAEEHLRAFF